jgi:hypothetical protein
MNYLKVLLAGVTATLIMTGFMMLAPIIGLPKMNAGEILGSMYGGNNVLGWIEHFVAGIVFAFIYAGFINHLLPVENNLFRGAIYGVLLCILTDLVFVVISLMGVMSWDQKESMSLMVFDETLACLIYGTILGAFITQKENIFAKGADNEGHRSHSKMMRHQPS